ncbi:T9SS type A sorting domain-containing protein [Flavihumibacter fluvii]|uniref:T9SS type A sorting domain-containing protein n=1 Tax=Flavihumibacter fluvii TaxID=2838157 RepID=UPI001BDE6BF1|nr:T9SS type A sorting domain-containing protein [Flavihumibacter fluvii]ULQ53678.1 T9SS type A sorting domain-containing protein [Flavihumibacter fluvii]
MKKLIIIILANFAGLSNIIAQITTAQNKANFGVDAEVRASFLGALPQPAATSHDWFANTLAGPPRFIIDTTGAAAITTRYISDLNFRKLPFFRVMKYDPFTILDGRMLIDAVYIRDYHGSDSTVFATSNKNGDNPQVWQGSSAQNIPDKNDLLDMYVHVRRAGSLPRLQDSLWFIGGIALDATAGNRYFDFELYQTDIFYQRSTLSFTGYGPDAGHTSWQFDPSTGAVTKPGDVIFSANFGGSGLQDLVARIWVKKTDLLINSPNFDWAGDFDGASAGATFGYASIKPKTTQNFYQGLQNSAATWSGPFQLLRANNSVQTTFDANQFLEFSVNMGTLGLDPISLLGGDPCGLPFRRILVKSRASSAFTAELKDFVGPFDFFDFQAADATADFPTICGDNMISTLSVTNPLPTSTYSWVTPDGNIVGDTFGYQITVDTPGTYIVRQQLLSGCNQYASDTVVVAASLSCGLLPHNRIDLKGSINYQSAHLDFTVSANENVQYYSLERSLDGKKFSTVKVLTSNGDMGLATYLTDDDISQVEGSEVYYRIKMTRSDGSIRYSEALLLSRPMEKMDGFTILPNPVSSKMQILIIADKKQAGVVKIFNALGSLVEMKSISLGSGNNIIGFEGLEKWSSGLYPVQVQVGEKLYTQKMIISRNK